MNNYDISKLMSILKNMNKEDLEQGIAKAQSILNAQKNDNNKK